MSRLWGPLLMTHFGPDSHSLILVFKFFTACVMVQHMLFALSPFWNVFSQDQKAPAVDNYPLYSEQYLLLHRCLVTMCWMTILLLSGPVLCPLALAYGYFPFPSTLHARVAKLTELLLNCPAPFLLLLGLKVFKNCLPSVHPGICFIFKINFLNWHR